MIDDHPMLAKIRKLLAKAEDDATTAEEAELYTAKAAQLVAEYGIDQALLATESPGRDRVGSRLVPVDAPYAADKAELLDTVATSLRCRAVHVKRHTTDGKEISVHLFGFESDLVRAELLFTSLLLQAATWMNRTPVPLWENKAAFRRSWLGGFRMAVGRRLVEAESAAAYAATDRRTSSGRSTALVLADRSALVRDALDEEYPHLRTARPRQLSGSGGADGWAAGQRADLGGTRVDGGTARAIG